MIDRFKKFFDQTLMPDDGADNSGRELGIEYATAALLIELARADFEEDDLERSLILAMLRDTFDLDDSVLDELLELAESGADEAHDVYQFTQLVNDQYDYEDKQKLIEKLWRVAFADGRLDRYEEQFIRKVAGLIHVAHGDFIKAKVDVLEQIEQDGG